MTGRVDLHVHTTASDGRCRPAEIVSMAAQLGLAAVAITDHDTTVGLAEALDAGNSFGIEVIPGVELSTDLPEGEAHVLGYFVRPNDFAFQQTLHKLREARQDRAQGILRRLRKLGLPLEWEEVVAFAGDGSVGRPHIAQAMLTRGYVSTIQEAFALYIGRHGPAYVERFRLPPEQAVSMILEAGGLPVLAHPISITEWVPRLVSVGLVGLEVYYTGYSPMEIDLLIGLAERYSLVATGGSDFHGVEIMPEALLGSVDVPYSAVIELRKRCAVPQSIL
ncbi:MAG: PHP domain-containing protein [Chloroflexi bacterium]|nr:PHP domain-containing protein [Chloroflexota bacterium]